jgi:hypothetical protein
MIFYKIIFVHSQTCGTIPLTLPFKTVSISTSGELDAAFIQNVRSQLVNEFLTLPTPSAHFILLPGVVSFTAHPTVDTVTKRQPR